MLGKGLVLETDRDVIVPITGIQAGNSSEWYGSQHLSWLALEARDPRTVRISLLAGGDLAVETESGAQQNG